MLEETGECVCVLGGEGGGGRGSYLGKVGLLRVGECPAGLHETDLGVSDEVGHSAEQEVRLRLEVSVKDGHEIAIAQHLDTLRVKSAVSGSIPVYLQGSLCGIGGGVDSCWVLSGVNYQSHIKPQ